MARDTRLIILDFDGTALGGYEPYARFPDGLSAFLDEWSAEGRLWATCTTWHPFNQDLVFAASAVKSRPVRMVGRSSMACGLYENGTLRLDAVWDAEMISYKAKFFDESLDEIQRFLRNLPGATVKEYFDHLFAVSYDDRERIAGALPTCPAVREKTYRIWSSTENSVQVWPWYLSKGVAVRKMLAALSIRPDETLIACDGVNDLPMLEPGIARMGVCPANADPQVKAAVATGGGIVSDLPYSDGIVAAVRTVMAAGR